MGSLSVAAQTPAATGTTTGAPGKGYSFKCSDTPSAQDWQSELAAIKPLAPIGAPLHAFLPPPAGPDKQSRCIRAMYDARIEALRRTGLFSSVDVREDPTPGIRPDTQGAGYWVWVDNFIMVISYEDSRRWILINTEQRLDAWTDGLPKFLKSVEASADKNSPAINVQGVGSNSYYGYKGREYISYSDIRPALMASADALLAATSRAQRVGHRALVRIPTEENFIADFQKRMQLGSVDPTGSFTRIAGSATYSWQSLQAKAIRKSGLFDETIIEESDDPAPDGDYDAVIWTNISDHNKWHVRTRGHGDALLQPQDIQTADQWVNRVRDALVNPAAQGAADAAPQAKPMSFTVDGTAYHSLDEVGAALKAKCDKLLESVTRIGTKHYGPILVVFPAHAQQDKSVVTACLPKGPATGAVNCEKQSDDSQSAIMGYMHAINDRGNDCLAAAIQRSDLFSAVSVKNTSEVEENDFQGYRYKMWVQPFATSGPAGLIVAKQTGGQTKIPLPPSIAFEKEGDLQKEMSLLQTALQDIGQD